MCNFFARVAYFVSCNFKPSDNKPTWGKCSRCLISQLMFVRRMTCTDKRCTKWQRKSFPANWLILNEHITVFNEDVHVTNGLKRALVAVWCGEMKLEYHGLCMVRLTPRHLIEFSRKDYIDENHVFDNGMHHVVCHVFLASQLALFLPSRD